jgi:SAM-dependent methyltransferase/uncharacterized protein YbaR (Trm112 family)
MQKNIKEEFLSLLTCPVCKDKLEFATTKTEFRWLKCKRNHYFPIANLTNPVPILIRDLKNWIDFQLNLSFEGLKKYISWSENDKQYLEVSKVWKDRLMQMIKILGGIKRDLQSIPAQEVVDKVTLQDVKHYKETFGRCWDDDNYIFIAYSPRIEDLYKIYINLLPDKTLVKYVDTLYSKIFELVKESLDGKSNARILEMGCGVGRTLYDCSTLSSTGLIVGLEYNFGKAFVCSKILNGDELSFRLKKDFGPEPPVSVVPRLNVRTNKVQLVIADADEPFPLKDSEWDIVIIAYLLGLLTDPVRFLQRTVKLLRPGGSLIVADDHGWYEDIREERRRTTPEMVSDILVGEGLKVYDQGDLPHIELYNDRYSHIHLTKFQVATRNHID